MIILAVTADFLDATDQPLQLLGQIKSEPATFALTEPQKKYWQILQQVQVSIQVQRGAFLLKSVGRHVLAKN